MTFTKPINIQCHKLTELKLNDLVVVLIKACQCDEMNQTWTVASYKLITDESHSSCVEFGASTAFSMCLCSFSNKPLIY